MHARAALLPPLRRAWLAQRRLSSAKPPAKIGVHAVTNRVKANTELETQAKDSGLPAAYTVHPQGAIQRRDVIEAMIVPRDQEEPILGKTRAWLTNGMAVLMFTILAMMYKASAYDHTTEVALMHEVAQELRRNRADAKKQLLACATESGQIPVGKGNVLRWWATGPSDCDVVVLLAAEDGENAVIWGLVHSQIAERVRILAVDETSGRGGGGPIRDAAPAMRVRVVTFDLFGPGTCATPTPDSLLMHRPLSLRLSDIDRVLQAASQGSGQGWASCLRGMLGTHPTPPVLLVTSGASCWSVLAYVGLHTPRVRGAVAVQPQGHLRGRHLAWLDAVPAASRIPHEEDPKLLETLLEAPLMPEGSISEEAARRMDHRDPRTKHLLQYYSNFGVPGWKEALGKRHAEELRRHRSKQHVLTSTEQQIVNVLGQRVGPSPSDIRPGANAHVPQVAVLTVGPDCLPSWIAPSARLPVEHMLLSSSTSLGLCMCNSALRDTLVAERQANAELVQAELSGGIAPLVVKAVKDSPTRALDDDTAVADALEAAQLWHAWERLPHALGLARDVPVEESFAYLQLQRELRALPDNFSVALLRKGSSGPSVLGVHSSLGREGPTAASRFNGVVSIPLQCPQAVVMQVMQILAAGDKGAAGTHSAGADNVDRKPVRRFGHVDYT